MALSQLWRTKSLDELMAETREEGHQLKKALGPWNLVALGIGAIIGAGIFATIGTAAAGDPSRPGAGPALMLSFVLTAIVCGFCALCYAEFASMVPVAGSAYTYAYATLGELAAWIIGWDLILEYAMSCAVVASHWTGYFNEFLRTLFGFQLPPQIMSDPFTSVMADGQPVQAWLNLPAVLILLACTAILVVGIKESATTNTILVVIKLMVVLFVIGLGLVCIDKANWTSVPVNKRNVTDTADFLER